MKRIYFIVLLALVFGLQSRAADYRRLVVGLENGQQLDVNLSDDLQVTFTAESLVARGSLADVEIPRSSIVSFSHSNTSDVSQLAKSGASLQRDGQWLCLSGVNPGERGVLTASDGWVVAGCISDSNGCRVSIDGLAKGVYVLGIGDRSFKIYIK